MGAPGTFIITIKIFLGNQDTIKTQRNNAVNLLAI